MNSEGDRQRVGFVGAGKMATALARGLVRSGFTSAERVLACDVVLEASRHFAEQTGCRIAATNSEVVAGSDIVIVAVKPQQFRDALQEVAGQVQPRHLLLSIAAGIPLETMSAALGAERRIVRVMPNTPCLVGASASAYCLGGAATPADGRLVQRLLGGVGLAIELPEKLLDAVTGLSGSGPAFVCVIIEALADGGVQAGLPRDVAQRLAAQTVLGTAQMILETGQHPAALKDAVASPGGTTIAGLRELERGALRGTLMSAVVAAAERSSALGRPAAR